MPNSKQLPTWPSWNPKYGADWDPADYAPPKSLEEIYEDQRAWEKRRLEGE